MPPQAELRQLDKLTGRVKHESQEVRGERIPFRCCLDGNGNCAASRVGRSEESYIIFIRPSRACPLRLCRIHKDQYLARVDRNSNGDHIGRFFFADMWLVEMATCKNNFSLDLSRLEMAIFLGKRTADLAALQERQVLLAGLEKEQTDRQQARDAHKKQLRQERERTRGNNDEAAVGAEAASDTARGTPAMAAQGLQHDAADGGTLLVSPTGCPAATVHAVTTAAIASSEAASS